MMNTLVRRLVLSDFPHRFGSRKLRTSGAVNQTKKKNSETKTYDEVRLSNLKELPTCYPHKFSVSVSTPRFIQKYNHLGNDESDLNATETVAGRINSIRQASKKLWFIDVHSQDTRLQVKASLKSYKDKQEFQKVVWHLRRGDVIGVRGHPERTKAGELSIVPSSVKLLAPCLRNLPRYVRGPIVIER